MKRLMISAVLFGICNLPVVPARGAMQKRDAGPDGGRILWQFDSGA